MNAQRTCVPKRWAACRMCACKCCVRGSLRANPSAKCPRLLQLMHRARRTRLPFHSDFQPSVLMTWRKAGHRRMGCPCMPGPCMPSAFTCRTWEVLNHMHQSHAACRYKAGLLPLAALPNCDAAYLVQDGQPCQRGCTCLGQSARNAATERQAQGVVGDATARSGFRFQRHCFLIVVVRQTPRRAGLRLGCTPQSISRTHERVVCRCCQWRWERSCWPCGQGHRVVLRLWLVMRCISLGIACVLRWHVSERVPDCQRLRCRMNTELQPGPSQEHDTFLAAKSDHHGGGPLHSRPCPPASSAHRLPSLQAHPLPCGRDHPCH
jgi:hypothetical protein